MSQMHEFWVKEQGNNIMHSTNIIIAHQHRKQNKYPKITNFMPASRKPNQKPENAKNP